MIFDNFPRSGTNFLSIALQTAFPHYEIAWGGHRIENIRTQERLITVVRHPRDCVPSWIECSDADHSFDEVLDWHERFMHATEQRFEEIFAVSFEQITSDLNKVMREYADRFSLRTPFLLDVSEIMRRLEKEFPNNSPRQLTAARKQLNLEVTSSSKYEQSCAAYERVLNKIKL